VRRYTTKRCEGCQLRSQCTANKRGRIIERSIYQEAIEENAKRVALRIFFIINPFELKYLVN